MYPYKIRIFQNEPQFLNILKQLEQDRVAPVPFRGLSTKITHKLKPIRPDIFLGPDSRYRDTYVALKPQLTLELKPIGKNGYEAIFKKLF